MSLLYFLADAFIRTFGITAPTGRARKRAALFIGALLLLLLLGVTATGYVIHTAMG